LTAGTLTATPALFDGVSAAQFTWPFKPGRKTVGIPYVFATVGRERRERDAQVPGAEEPSFGLYLRLIGQRLLGDNRTQGEQFNIPDGLGGTAFSVPSELSVRIAGGSPGEQVPLTIDSMRLPAYLAVNHYDFDDLQDAENGGRIAGDLFFRAPAQVGAGVELDATESAQGFGSLRFMSGGNGVTVPSGQSFSPTGSFGISTFVRLDQAAAQTIVSKQGAYELRTVLVNGEPRVEFSVMNTGVRRSVVSSDALPIGEWSHVSVRLDNGYLLVHLGEEGIVNSGDAAGLPDVNTAPTVIGRGFTGHLDEVAFFDFTKQPYALFSNGLPRATVTLDANGEAVLPFFSTGAFQGVSAAALERYGQNFVRIEVPPLSADDWFMYWMNLDQAMKQLFQIHVAPHLVQCTAGIIDGESGGNVGMACDMMLNLVGFFPPAGLAVDLGTGARDVVVGVNHLIEGKDTFANIVKSSLGAVTVMAASKGPAGRWARLMKSAHRLLGGAQVVDRFMMRETLVTIAKGLNNEAPTFPRLLEALGDETGRVTRVAQDALVDILAKSEDLVETARALERLGGAADYEKLVGTITGAMKQIEASSELRGTIASGLGARIVAQLDEVATTSTVTGAATRLSADAMYGTAVFLARGMRSGWKPTRLSRTWSDLGRLNREKQFQAFEDMMKWVAEGERKGIKGWNEFLGSGPGRGGFGPQSTQGAYFVLEYLSRKMKWENIVELERGIGKCAPLRSRPSIIRCDRYVDIVSKKIVGGVEREVRKELKNLSAGAVYRAGSQVKFDVDDIVQASLRANNGEIVDADLIERLSRLEYVLRGSPDQMKAAVSSLRKKIGDVLTAIDRPDLAKHVIIETLGWDLPI
jgi:hypothetical protein